MQRAGRHGVHVTLKNHLPLVQHKKAIGETVFEEFCNSDGNAAIDKG